MLNKCVLLEEKHFNTFNRHINNIYRVQDRLVGVDSVESQSASPSLDSSPLKPYQVAGRSTRDVVCHGEASPCP